MNTKTTFDIKGVLEKLSKNHPIFNCELEFQFYLAWTIKEIYQDKFDIKIEYPFISDKGKNINIDLLLIDQNKNFIPIELKYRTNAVKCGLNGYCYCLKAQSAEDITKYSYLKDISRIEHLKNNDPNYLVGYAIIISNQENIWIKTPNPKYSDYEFSLQDGLIISKGMKNWHTKTSESIKKKYPYLKINNNYQIKWNNYSNFKQKHGEFKSLIVEV